MEKKNEEMKRKVEEIRLNKFLSNCGVSSRREADALIEQGSVLVNNTVIAKLGMKIIPHQDTVSVLGKVVSRVEKKRYIVLNKPRGVITTTKDDLSRTTVMSFLKSSQKVYPVGRLDKDTDGVLLFTNDGPLATRLMAPKFLVKKRYIAILDRKASFDDLKIFRSGMRLKDTGEKVLPCFFKINKDKKKVSIELTEGKNRQIRRMFWSIGYKVKKLSRVQYGNISLLGLKRGEYRDMKENEVVLLYKLTNLSTI